MYFCQFDGWSTIWIVENDFLEASTACLPHLALLIMRLADSHIMEEEMVAYASLDCLIDVGIFASEHTLLLLKRKSFCALRVDVLLSLAWFKAFGTSHWCNLAHVLTATFNRIFSRSLQISSSSSLIGIPNIRNFSFISNQRI